MIGHRASDHHVEDHSVTDRRQLFDDGWERACQLHRRLSAGGEIPSAPPTTVRLAPDERTLIDTELGYERSLGRAVAAPLEAEHRSSWKFGGGLLGAALKAVSNRMVRARNERWTRWADEQAAPRWQHFGATRTVLTDRRILCEQQGWTVFGFDGVIELRPDPRAWQLELYFDDTAPLRLVGAFAPWCGVALAKLLYGPQGLQLPALADLRPGERPQLPRGVR